MERSTVSRDCQRLVERGWLTTVQGEGSGSLLYRLTPDGASAVNACLADWRSAQERVRRFLGDDACSALQIRTDQLWRALPANA